MPAMKTKSREHDCLAWCGTFLHFVFFPLVGAQITLFCETAVIKLAVKVLNKTVMIMHKCSDTFIWYICKNYIYTSGHTLCYNQKLSCGMYVAGSRLLFAKRRCLFFKAFVASNPGPYQTRLAWFKHIFHSMTLILGLHSLRTAGRINMPINAAVDSHCSWALYDWCFSCGIVSHITFSTFPFTCMPRVAAGGRTTVLDGRRKASWQIFYTCQTLRRWKTARQW